MCSTAKKRLMGVLGEIARPKYNACTRKGRGRHAGPTDGGEREIESSRPGATEHLTEQKKPL